MDTLLLLSGAILLLGLLLNRWWSERGLPIIVLFILIGSVLGFVYQIDLEPATIQLIEPIASVILIFIMFYGGFGINWQMGRAMLKPASILASLGVLLTFAMLALFNYYVLGIPLLIALLISAVLSPTDATSVFSILKFHQLSLVGGTAPTLELESGSNDPFAYMIVAVIMKWYLTGINSWQVILLIVLQVGIALLMGFLGAKLLKLLLRSSFSAFNNAEILMMIAMVIVVYSLTELFQGNGYLSVYVMGLIVGTQRFNNKYHVIHFFEGSTGLSQLILFTLMGLVVDFNALIEYVVPATVIFLVLTFVIRPIAVRLLLLFERDLNQSAQNVIAWAGLRGASSLIFTLMAMSRLEMVSSQFFHIVFIIVLYSLLLQGSLLPIVAKKVKAIDLKENILTTFSDFQESIELQIIEIDIDEKHEWRDVCINDAKLLTNLLILLIERGNRTILPTGQTKIKLGDKVYIAAPSLENDINIHLETIQLSGSHPWINRPIKQIGPIKQQLILAVVRDGEYLVPNGATVLKDQDRLILYTPL